VHDLGKGKGHLFEMDITTNRVDAMNHYGVAREAAAIYNIPLRKLDAELPVAKAAAAFPVHIEAKDLCGRFTAQVVRESRSLHPLAMWQISSHCWGKSRSRML